MLSNELKKKMMEAREKYFTYLGSRDIEYEVVVFKEHKHWEENCKEDPEVSFSEQTPFYSRIVQKIEAVIEQGGMGDIVVRHNDNTLFIIFQEQGYHWWPRVVRPAISVPSGRRIERYWKGRFRFTE